MLNDGVGGRFHLGAITQVHDIAHGHLLLLVSLAVSGGSATRGQNVEVDRETCLQRGDVWSETNQECYNSTAFKRVNINTNL